MAETSGPIGRRKLLRVRLGDDMVPITVSIALRTGVLNADQCSLVTRLYKRESDMDPIATPQLKVTPLGVIDRRARYLIEFSREDAIALAGLADDSARTRSPITAWWTASFRDATGRQFPILFGPVVLNLGASSAG